MIKKIMQSVAEGRGIVGVSLPVRIFEPRSLLERIVDWWAFAPHMLSQAHSLDPVSRLKCVIGFAFAGLYVSVSQIKPFNPILGKRIRLLFRMALQSIVNTPTIIHRFPTSWWWAIISVFTVVTNTSRNQTPPSTSWKCTKKVQTWLNFLKRTKFSLIFPAQKFADWWPATDWWNGMESWNLSTRRTIWRLWSK